VLVSLFHYSSVHNNSVLQICHYVIFRCAEYVSLFSFMSGQG